MCNKIFDSDAVAVRKSDVTLTLNKPAYVGTRIIDSSKVLIYESKQLFLSSYKNIILIFSLVRTNFFVVL